MTDLIPRITQPFDVSRTYGILNMLINEINAINQAMAGGAVISVNGQTGIVVLTTADIADSTNARYVTDAELVNIALLPNITGNAATASAVAVGGITGLGTGVATLLAGTPSGTVGLVGTTSPTLVTPILGVATATTINKVTLTAPATGATLTIADGKTFTASNTLTLSGTDGTSLNLNNARLKVIGGTSFGPGATVATGKMYGYFTAPYAGTITGWSISADAGTCTIKTWKVANGSAVPTVSNNISTSGVALSSGTHVRSSDVSDFTSVAITAGDIIAFNISAVSGVSELTFELEISVT